MKTYNSIARIVDQTTGAIDAWYTRHEALIMKVKINPYVMHVL